MPSASPPSLEHATKCQTAALEFRSAIARRSEQVNATDRFFRDLMCYQWRLEAIDMLLSEVSQLRNEEHPQLESFSRSCMQMLVAQREAALSGLAERAGSYALGLPGKQGTLVAIASTPEEKEIALSSWREIVEDTYTELEMDGSALLQQASTPGGLEKLVTLLSRRQQFWKSQLEEVWNAWHACTAAMYAAGDEAAKAFSELARLCRELPRVNEVTITDRALPLETLEALASCVVAVMGADLWDPVGLSGWQPSEVSPLISPKSPVEARKAVIRPLLPWLRRGSGLEILGIMLLDESWPDAPTPPPPPAACALEAYRGLIREALVRVLWKAGKEGDSRLAFEVLEFCVDLNDFDLARELRELRNSSGRTSEELARSCQHDATADLIVEWPYNDPLPMAFQADKLDDPELLETNPLATAWKLQEAYGWLRDAILPA